MTAALDAIRAPLPYDFKTPCPAQEFCGVCGRILIETDEDEGIHDHKTGKRLRRHWHSCPRYFRSWRNLWMGGSPHESHAKDLAILGREFR